MDIYGVSMGIRACAKIYFQSMRATGRTTHMLSLVENGDLIIVHPTVNGKDLLRQLSMRGITKVDVRSASTLDEIRQMHRENRGCYKRVHLDHSFVDAYYMSAIEKTGNAIDAMLRDAHSQTMSELDFHSNARKFML